MRLVSLSCRLVDTALNRLASTLTLTQHKRAWCNIELAQLAGMHTRTCELMSRVNLGLDLGLDLDLTAAGRAEATSSFMRV